MMRALYTAATGMKAGQTNVDTIANNLSNVNTNGYKTTRTEFKSLLYQTIQTKTSIALRQWMSLSYSGNNIDIDLNIVCVMPREVRTSLISLYYSCLQQFISNK